MNNSLGKELFVLKDNIIPFCIISFKQQQKTVKKCCKKTI